MENPAIEWKQNSQKKYLSFIFTDRLTEQNAAQAIEQWRKSFAAYQGEKIILVWNCLKMTGYDSGARNLWQTSLKEMKSQIACIWLISESSLIKMGASVMSLFASFNIEVVKSENEINFNK